MTYARRATLIVSLGATTRLALVLGVTDPAPPLTYPTRFFVWNLMLAWIPVFFAAGFAFVRRRIWLRPVPNRLAPNRQTPTGWLLTARYRSS